MKHNLKSIAEHGKRVFNQNQRIIHLGKLGQVEDAVTVFETMPHKNLVTYNSMVSVFAKNGRISDARKLFDKMPHRNLVSWNTMIAGYVHNNMVEEAAHLFDTMPGRDNFSWALMITCYSRYAKKGHFREAEEVFERTPVKDLVSYNSMLAGYTQNGKMHQALQFFERMTNKNAVSWNLMIAGFVNCGDPSSAWQLFEKIPNPSAVSWVTMLCGFARHGKLMEARKLFDSMPDKNMVSWNAMIAAYVQDLQIGEAVKLFKEMPDKDSVSWTTIINGYIRVGKLNEARKIYNQMPCKDMAAQTALLSGLIQNGRIDEAGQMFSRIHVRDAVCWNSMISGYSQSGRMEEAYNLFRQMPIKNAVSWNTMISGYAQAGKMDRAAEIFHSMEGRNIISWNSLIAGFLQNSLYLDALKSFVIMGQEEKKPDQSTFACALSACANLAALQLGKQLHEYILKSGYVNDIFVSNALIAMYAKCGRVQKAEQVFRDIWRADLISWNSLISGYALNGLANEAFKAFEQMLSEGIAPDEFTFMGMLSTCSHAGLALKGLALFKCMVEEFSIEPLAEHYSCLVDLLGRVGRFEEAFNVVRGMKVKANAGLWGSLLAASRVHKNLELGRVAAKMLLELEPANASNYVTLSNMLAEAGRWKEVERLRVLMREKQATKLPGCSWIEIQNQIQSFISDDPSKSRAENIPFILNSLTEHIRDKCISDMNQSLEFYDWRYQSVSLPRG
ncbi:pentatricopeptide repeat-containing protein At4g02750-like [Arachis ipaensis]|uniref:Pentatricopeptide repeat-containing protein n=1 Tax=Arachis hypogaea TaxID=3818 RepID=A0A444XRG4_ARAHY|nr:pentatricopeptide repeat-containing protein At4g02750-like [Arachis ipaensis]XP_025679296.1 pentatricopeptide repeat-containing protein At4g02750 isoform X2 [Arachis hypogaea]RYQ92301.1 hypothetical protein Ahy_B09g098489 isoform C [Arachis hypogaea]